MILAFIILLIATLGITAWIIRLWWGETRAQRRQRELRNDEIVRRMRGR